MKKKFLQIICCVIFAFSANAQTTTVTVQYGSETGNTGTFNVALPNSVTNVNGKMWGGGGGGGGSNTNHVALTLLNLFACGSGGAGGGYSSFNWGASYTGNFTIIVGNGGYRGSGSGTSNDANNGGDGTASGVVHASVSKTAGGGGYGRGAYSPGNASPVARSTNYTGGDGDITGGEGGGAVGSGNGGAGQVCAQGGYGGSSPNGGGQIATVQICRSGGGSVSIDGSAGIFPGGGGSGAATAYDSGYNPQDRNGIGGLGANGKVLFNFDYFNPSTPVISSALPDMSCFSGNVVLSVTNDETVHGVGYQWYKDGVALSGETGTSYTATSPGTYKVSAIPLSVSSIPFTGAVSVTVSPANAYASVNGTTLNFTGQFSREITFMPSPGVSISSPYQNINGIYYLFTTSKTVNLADGITASTGILKFYTSDQVTEVSPSVMISGATTEYYVQAVSDCESSLLKLVVNYQGNISVWLPGNLDDGTMSDADKTNYNDYRNWSQGAVPNSNSTVYIAAAYTDGNPVQHFPYLQTGNTYWAEDIYICFGAEIGNPQYLTYTHAHVQYNLGLQSMTQQTFLSDELNSILLLGDSDPYDHLVFSASLSAPPITRNKWHTFTAPLQGMVSGDYAFGGVPYTFIRKFDVNLTYETSSAFKGSWTSAFSSNVEPLQPAEGFALWVNEYQDKVGYHETASGLNEIPAGVDGRTVGLSQINGILEFPHHNDNYVLHFDKHQLAHRTHQSMGGDESKFYRFHDDLSLVYQDESVTRSNPNRFAFEGLSTYQVKTGPESNVVLVGNPYPSTIDFDLFYAENSGKIKSGYTLWTGNSFSTYAIGAGSSGSTVIDNYIAPGQSFLLELAEGVTTADLSFSPDITVQKMPPVNSMLRSNGILLPGLLNIEVTNSSGRVKTCVVEYENGSSLIGNLDMSKILTSFNALPEIYTLKVQKSGVMQGVAANFIPGDEEMLIPIGVATTAAGNLSFTFSGMDNFGGQVSFIDSQTQLEIDITGLGEYVYDCSYTPAKNAKNETLASEDRFFLRILQLETGFSENQDADLQIGVSHNESGWQFYANSNIRSIILYDMSGNLVLEKPDINNLAYTLHFEGQRQLYIAQVVTDLGIKYLKVLK